MQYRSPVGPGPSGNTCPRWAPQLRQTTSVRTIPWLVSVRPSTPSSVAGAVKLGHPVPESNLVDESKSGSSQQTQRVDALGVVVPVDAAERPLRGALAGHRVLLGRELLAPVGLALADVVGHRSPS